MDELIFLSGDRGGPNYLVVEEVDALEFLSSDPVLAGRVLLTNELAAWDKLSDEALEEFEKLVEESESGQPRRFLDKQGVVLMEAEEYNLELARLAELFDECQGCRYGSCDIWPLPADVNMEFNELSDLAIAGLLAELKLWDELSDEALEESEQPLGFLDKIRYWSRSDWMDWLMGR